MKTQTHESHQIWDLTRTVNCVDTVTVCVLTECKCLVNSYQPNIDIFQIYSFHQQSVAVFSITDILIVYFPTTKFDDDQPKLRGSGVDVTLVCEYPRDPEGI